ncbi:TetR/AcrR family transcriptional regulator [Streptomyces litchfieldiae]|uniref:TetR/AcrR family transcriptional regulator n=1 Tax=Streptomyces litchfieldiae TaxID=3075543 RepID=A0ABU2MT26_9ACTN|nr:TetR/AcrR family transcriptional regulator [Streptomyces sp. DSM 44938]MDT0344685.1 TetR/AcrR family transcriptional regulator [Streptomyces sp. DSM 44938]
MPVPKGSTLDPARTRAAILDMATDALYEHGLDGVSVGRLCTEAGISKETLYRHFGSKDGLVQAVVQARSDRVTRWLSRAATAAGEDPADQLAAVFDALSTWHAEPGFRGCAIVNAAVQHHADPVRPIAARHFDRRLDLLAGIAARAGVADPERLGRQLLQLVVGATVIADLRPDPGAARDAREAALALLANAAQSPSTR